MTCDLNHGDDQRQILDAADAMLAAGYPLSRLREGTPDDLARIAEFGGFLLALPEAQGGAGFTLVEEALLHVRLGRHLVTPRALATTLAARLTADSDPDLAQEIATGSRAVAPALDAQGGPLLIDGAAASLALTFGDRGIALLDISGCARTGERGLGQALTLHRLAPGTGTRLAAGETMLADLLVSAQLLGVAEAARDLAVGYAQVREQFGKPIGTQQAIKHRAADMEIAAERLSAQLDFAAIALRDGRDDAAFQVAALRRLAPGAALGNARACIQIHGGIGYSAEADAHHFVRQAHVLARLGDPAPLLDMPAPLAPLRPAH